MNGDQQKPQEGGSVPPPPERPDMKMRTMDSDVKSVQESGGGTPEPQTVEPPIFQPDQTTPPVIEEAPRRVRPWLMWLFIIVLLFGIGVLGYYYIWPLVFPEDPKMEDEATGQEETPTAGTPTEQPVHQSVFGFGLASMAQLDVSDLTLVNIISALQSEAVESPTSGDVKEVYFTEDERLVAFNRLITTLMPELTGSDLETTLKAAYSDDFSGFLYYDDNGVWPGYVVEKKDDGFPNDPTLFADIEFASINNVFLTPPAGDRGAFRSGTINGYANRYAPYLQTNASFSYGLFGDYFIVATSYNGLVRAIELLGL